MKMNKISLFVLLIALLMCCSLTVLAQEDDIDDTPYPFHREFDYSETDSPTGKDVYVLQKFLNRWGKTMYNRLPNVATTAIYDKATAAAVKLFKKEKKISDPTSALFDKETATLLANEYVLDGYRDNDIPARLFGLKFKVYIPVYQNRSIETTATLLDEDNNILHRFTARTRAHTIMGEEPWPAFDSATPGLNEHTPWGNTPSGLSLVDFNSPEPPAFDHMYGPYNVIRAVRGLEGNAEFLVPQVRNGILIHTGYWEDHGWEGPPHHMPNSAGCVHIYLEDTKKISDILLNLGCVANENPLGKLPYPFSPQGLMSVEVLKEGQKPLY